MTLHTDLGDMKLELYCEQCPRACEVRTQWRLTDFKWFDYSNCRENDFVKYGQSYLLQLQIFALAVHFVTVGDK